MLMSKSWSIIPKDLCGFGGVIFPNVMKFTSGMGPAITDDNIRTFFAIECEETFAKRWHAGLSKGVLVLNCQEWQIPIRTYQIRITKQSQLHCI